MSWEDREWAGDDEPQGRYGRPGGDLTGLRPTLDNPLTWALPLGRIARIEIRVHVIFLVFLVIELVRAALELGPLGRRYTLVILGCLFVIVLLHELGHCFACRLVRGQANEILMWPLGGLAFCRPPLAWRAHLVTAVGGPAVNVVICLVLGPLLYFRTGQLGGIAVPRLLKIDYALAFLGDSWLLTVLYLANWVSLVLLLFNLLPVYPLDGGRIVQALLWPRVGYSRSMRYAVWTGYFGAIGLGIFGFVLPSVTLVLIAVFGGLTCYLTSRQLAFTDEFMGFDDEGYPGADPAVDVEPRPDRRQRRRQRELERRQREEARVERILRKINDYGLESLTLTERRLLRRATRRRQQESQKSAP